MNPYINIVSPDPRFKIPPEYAETFSLMETRAEKLLATALQFNETKKSGMFDCPQIVREEFVSNGDPFLPRGYYCPSPVIDLIVGNCKRGKILKRVTLRSRITHRYIYGKQGLMIVEKFGNDRKCFEREYLLHEAQKTIGISVNEAGNIRRVVEELYKDGKSIEFFYATFEAFDGNHRVTQTHHEQYFYDEQGLCQCSFNYAGHGHWPVINCETYNFNRVDGYLQSYYSVKNPSVIYTPKVKRLAMPPYFVGASGTSAPTE